MERYDGKTEKADYRKYALVAAAAVAVILVCCILLHVFGSDDVEADYRLIYGGYSAPSDDTLEYLENYIGEIVGDINGDGETVVEILCVTVNVEDYGNFNSGFLSLGNLMGENDIYLVLLTDEAVATNTVSFNGLSFNFCGQEGYFIDLPEEIADTEFSNRAALNDSELFTYLGFADGPLLYGSVIEGQDDEATQLALEILEQMIYGDLD